MRHRRNMLGFAFVVAVGSVSACGADRSYGRPGASPSTAKEEAPGKADKASVHRAAEAQDVASPSMAEPPPTPGATSVQAGAPSPEAAPPSAPPPRAPSPVPVQAPEAMDPQASYARARTRLSEARRQLDIAAGQRDCANACRALDSMERAAGQVCELARSSEERRTCRDAEDQVGAARMRVKNACGECPKK